MQLTDACLMWETISKSIFAIIMKTNLYHVLNKILLNRKERKGNAKNAMIIIHLRSLRFLCAPCG